jgi:hypothetical protein
MRSVSHWPTSCQLTVTRLTGRHTGLSTTNQQTTMTALWLENKVMNCQKVDEYKESGALGPATSHSSLYCIAALYILNLSFMHVILPLQTCEIIKWW